MNMSQKEKFSSCYTLSDMEIFIYPDLMYAQLLANIMSPEIWKWRNDPWFAGYENKKESQRIQRLKQYIMNHYTFNLDLETWGLTDRKIELKRFADVIDPDVLKKSNALFGYEGDKYYFDIGIRRHFGLEKYNSDVIPYWKTETVEAMNAFKYKDGYKKGAGECVSLSLLYAAALFVVARIPLEKIFLLATPLHSQNFILSGDGVMTNNRRILTKNMWFNGTALSAKARRAVENEKITIISHASGYLHYHYSEATINPHELKKFRCAFQNYLTADLSYGILTNFLRLRPEYQKSFQFRISHKGRDYYIPSSTVFRYEHTSRYNLSSINREKILEDIDDDECFTEIIENRIVIQDVEKYLKENHLSLESPCVSRKDCPEKASCRFLEPENFHKLKTAFQLPGHDTEKIFSSFLEFAKVIPEIDDDKRFLPSSSVSLDVDFSRQQMIESLKEQRKDVPAAFFAFYTYRDLAETGGEFFFDAALNRSPVTLNVFEGKEPAQVMEILDSYDNISIYPGDTRAAQPDEVVNFCRGDGFEKAVVLAVIIKQRTSGNVSLLCEENHVVLCSDGGDYRFKSTMSKSLKKVSESFHL